MADGGRRPTELNTRVPHPARMHDYWLGGRDNFAADRELADLMARASPNLLGSVRAGRAFLKRAVRFLVEEAGIRQFLDIGSGLPVRENVHEVAQRLAPDARVVYVDNDPVVLAHGGALLEGAPPDLTRVVMGDLRYPAGILRDPAVNEMLDFGRPVGLLLNAVLHYLTDEDDPADVVARLRETLAPGSHLVIAHLSGDLAAAGEPPAARRTVEIRPFPYVFRGHAEILAYFDGFRLVEPGLVRVSEWRPDGAVPEAHRHADLFGGVGRRN